MGFYPPIEWPGVCHHSQKSSALLFSVRKRNVQWDTEVCVACRWRRESFAHAFRNAWRHGGALGGTWK